MRLRSIIECAEDVVMEEDCDFDRGLMSALEEEVRHLTERPGGGHSFVAPKPGASKPASKPAAPASKPPTPKPAAKPKKPPTAKKRPDPNRPVVPKAPEPPVGDPPPKPKKPKPAAGGAAPPAKPPAPEPTAAAPPKPPKPGNHPIEPPPPPQHAPNHVKRCPVGSRKDPQTGMCRQLAPHERHGNMAVAFHRSAAYHQGAVKDGGLHKHHKNALVHQGNAHAAMGMYHGHMRKAQLAKNDVTRHFHMQKAQDYMNQAQDHFGRRNKMMSKMNQPSLGHRLIHRIGSLFKRNQ